METSGHVIRWARLYDILVPIMALGREGALRRQTLDLAALQSGERVLDVGCGTGTLLIAALRAEPTLVARGIDPARPMVERARAKAAAADVAARFDVGAIEALPFEDASHDAVLSSLMLHHLPQEVRRAGLAEVHRVLCPGGRFVAVDFAGEGSMLHRLGSLFTGGRDKTRVDEVREALEEVGFDRVDTSHLHPRTLFGLVARKASSPRPGLSSASPTTAPPTPWWASTSTSPAPRVTAGARPGRSPTRPARRVTTIHTTVGSSPPRVASATRCRCPASR